MTNDSQNKPSSSNEQVKPPANPAASETKNNKQESSKVKKPVRWVQIRLIPIWLRIVIVLVLIVLAMIVGAMIGYGVIGNGDAKDVFKPDTWRHMFDIMNGKE